MWTGVSSRSPGQTKEYIGLSVPPECLGVRVYGFGLAAAGESFASWLGQVGVAAIIDFVAINSRVLRLCVWLVHLLLRYTSIVLFYLLYMPLSVGVVPTVDTYVRTSGFPRHVRTYATSPNTVGTLA